MTRPKRCPSRRISARFKAYSASSSLIRSCAQVEAVVLILLRAVGLFSSDNTVVIGISLFSSWPSGCCNFICSIACLFWSLSLPRSLPLRMPATCIRSPCGEVITNWLASVELRSTTRVAVKSKACAALLVVSLVKSIKRPPLRCAICLRNTGSVLMLDEML